MKIPGLDHPISVTPTGRQVTVRVGDRVIGESATALSLAEADYPVVQYVPLADVDPDVLQPTDTVTNCPYKGDASYYSLVIGDEQLTDAAWIYRNPHPAVAPIAGHLAFYPTKVRIDVAPDTAG